MKCFSPIRIKNPKNKGEKPFLDVPCGRCVGCLTNRRQDWQIRLEQELKSAKSAYFITLTYDDENLVYADDVPTLSKVDLQKFYKRLRYHYGKPIKYYCIGEYGSRTKRPHYHAIIFNLPVNREDTEKLVRKAWAVQGKELGLIHIGSVTPASIAYCTKYIMQKYNEKPGIQKEFALMSKRPAIGADYIKKMSRYHKGNIERFYVTKENGHIFRLPRYYRDKIYTKQEKEKFAKIQDETRYNDNDRIEWERKNPSLNWFEYVDSVKKDAIRKAFRTSKENLL